MYNCKWCDKDWNPADIKVKCGAGGSCCPDCGACMDPNCFYYKGIVPEGGEKHAKATRTNGEKPGAA